jgi:hypothetical protein
LVNLFAALGSVPDPSFQAYVERIKDDCNKDNEHVTANYLMSRCEIKCKTLQRSGNYNVPSKEEEKIIALSAEVDRMKAMSSVLQAKIASQQSDRGGGRGDGCHGGRGGWGTRANTGVWAWKDVPPPPPGSLHTKVVESKTYHWCPKHLTWCTHTPEDCHMEAPEDETPSAEALASEAIANDQG